MKIDDGLVDVQVAAGIALETCWPLANAAPIRQRFRPRP